jgi:predicted 3-demethylubiquinone-9 3-methyltransferase (glyoxalase superfamily)
MAYKSEIESCISQIAELEQSFLAVKDIDILPLSFFSESMDRLDSLKRKVFEIESTQLQRMSEHLQQSEEKLNEQETANKVQHTVPPVSESHKGILGDVIVRRIYADFNRSLTLNQRFMFRRELFNDNIETMDNAFNHINSCHTMAEAVNFLNDTFHISWDTESGAVLRELLEKRFA